MVTMTTIQPPSAFLKIVIIIVVKNHPISNASWIHNFQLLDPKLCEVTDLSLLNFYGGGSARF